MLIDEYTIVKTIAIGETGEVALGFRKGSQTKYAFKKKELSKYSMNKEAKRYLNNEIYIMKDINHPNIIRLIDIKINSKSVFIITEYCNGGNLEDYLEKYLKVNKKALPEEIVQNIMRQLIDVFRYLYNKKIMHRSINLRHILINYENEIDKENNNIMKGKIKIIHFSFARYLKKEEFGKSSLGNFINMHPSIIKKMKKREYYENTKYDIKEDIWSLGIICYELLVGKFPFDSQNNKAEYFVPITLSKEAILFINCMLQYYHKDRLSVDELYNHEFLKKNVKDFNKLDLDIIKKYAHNSKIKINTIDDYVIKDILAKQIGNVKNQEI